MVETSTYRRTIPQVLAVLVKNLLMFGYGMTLGFPTIVIPAIQAVNGQAPDGGSLALTVEQISWFGSLNLLCVPLGCIFSGAFTDLLGKRLAMQLINVPIFSAWMFYYFSTNVYHLYVALALTGISGGLMEAPVITYVAEITEPRIRGALAATGTTSIMVALLLQYTMGSLLPWRTVAIISCFLPILSTVALLFVPESPHWLLLRGRVEEARKSLMWLRGEKKPENIQTEFNGIHEFLTEKAKERGDNLTMRQRVRPYGERQFLLPFTLIFIIFFFGSFSGTQPLQTFAVQIFDALQSPIDKYYATVLLGVSQLIGALICIFSVHTTGKRMLAFISSIGIGVCCLGTACYAQYMGSKDLLPKQSSEESPLNWLPMVLVLSSALFAHLGIRLLPWMMIGEVFPSTVRSGASGFSSSLSYIFGFLANNFFFRMVTWMTLPGTFFFYAAVAIIGCVVLYFIMPETEGRTLIEIEDHFMGKKSLDDHQSPSRDPPGSESKDEQIVQSSKV